MTQFYLGVKIVEAWEQEKEDRPGYAVKYEDGYISWSPKDVFEKFYYPMGNQMFRVTQEMVDKFIKNTTTNKLEDKTVFMTANLLTGFTQYETSSCVDPQVFDFDIGHSNCFNRIKDRIWMLLGFVLQWGRFGLKK